MGYLHFNGGYRKWPDVCLSKIVPPFKGVRLSFDFDRLSLTGVLPGQRRK
jgi:hypothetical protein